MKKRRIPAAIINITRSFLTGRTMQMCFNGTMTATLSTPTGIPQGSPLSPILYMIYNADLLEKTATTTTQTPRLALGFINDIAYGVVGTTTEENVKVLKQTLEASETWRQKHGAQFEPSKYILIHFTRKKAKTHNPEVAIQIGDTTIHPTKEANYLGVIFDQKLKFQAHLNHAIKKGTKFALVMASIAKCTWGTPFKYVRRLYTQQ